MSDTKQKAWRCLVCGYVHHGAEPPEYCPVCGVDATSFEAIQRVPTVATGSGLNIRVMIVGAGIAGVSAAEAVRQAAPHAAITLLSEEAALPYYRLNLTRYLAGDITLAALPIHPAAWYAEQQIELLLGTVVAAICLDSHALTLADGTVHTFDKLILAMGSHPFVPPLPGVELQGVFTLRTTEQAQALMAVAVPGTPCVCIGGGVLGLETAVALARRGVAVTVLESHGWLMPRQLNRTGGDYLERYLCTLGVTLRKNARTMELLGSAGKIHAVRLDDGQEIPAGVVILATGVRPNTHLARRLGLEVAKGVVVNQQLRSSHPDVYAAGDVAEHNGVLYGAWGASQFQGSIAGLNAVGATTLFGGIPRSNSLKIAGLDVTSLGVFEAPDGSYQPVEQHGEKEYAHFLFHDGQLQGAILIGHAGLVSATKTAIEEHADFSDLLTATDPAPAVIAKLQE